MKKNWLRLMAMVGMLAVLIITSVTPAMAAGSLSANITVTLLNTSINLGSYATEYVWVGRASSTSPQPTGTVNFQVKRGPTGSWITYASKSSPTVGSVSAQYKPSSAGTYYFRAVYSGDSHYSSSTSAAVTLTVKSSAPLRR
jgi:hypothetical protein